MIWFTFSQYHGIMFSTPCGVKDVSHPKIQTPSRHLKLGKSNIVLFGVIFNSAVAAQMAGNTVLDVVALLPMNQ